MAASSSDTPKKRGLSDSEPKKKTVGTYDERPYGEAITDEHRARLKEEGIEVTSKTATPADARVQST